MQAKLADFYENMALNYNYLGFNVKAKKVCRTGGIGGHCRGRHRLELRDCESHVMSDRKGHFSYLFTLKRQKKN